MFDVRDSSRVKDTSANEKYKLFVRIHGGKFSVLALYMGIPGEVPHVPPQMRAYSIGELGDSVFPFADWVLSPIPEQEIEQTARALARTYRCRYAFICREFLGPDDFFSLVLPYLVEHELDDNQRMLFKLIA